MAESLDIFRYVSYLRFRWRWIAISCAVALVLALGISLALPREFTATARIVIEPPGGADPRSSVVLSPGYLESLKTYEEFAESDSLFQKALDQFQLRASLGARPIESLKKHVLKVAIVRNTRVLEISATLQDPRIAQQLAKSVAQSTVELSRSLMLDGDRELLKGVEAQASQAQSKLDSIETTWAHLTAEEPVTELQAETSKTAEVRASLEQQVLSAEQEIADAAQRQKTAGEAERVEAGKESANATARLAEIHKQLQSVDEHSQVRERLLATRMAHRDKMEAERKAAQTTLASVELRLSEAREASGYRGEQLRIIDPGIVPERPSSPNVPLNLMAALLLGLALPMVYLLLELNYQEHSVTARRVSYPAEVSKTR